VEQELHTLLELLSSASVFSGVRVTGSLVLCVMFCKSLFVSLSFNSWPLCCLSFFDLRFWLPHWYLQTLLSTVVCNFVNIILRIDFNQSMWSKNILEWLSGCLTQKWAIFQLYHDDNIRWDGHDVCFELHQLACGPSSVPDLPLCLGVLKHRAPLGGGAIFLPNIFFYDGFLLMWCNFKFEGVLFRSDSRHNNRFDCLCRPTRSTSFRAQVRGLIT
jgi:hypothetical protein